MSSSVKNNPWSDPKETQRWVNRKIEDAGTKLPRLSTCEWITTVIITFLISAQLYAERAIMVTALINTSDQFGWNSLAEVTLVICFYLGYLFAQIPAGYLSDHRLDVISSLSGVDQITGEVVLNSPVEKSMGATFFGVDGNDDIQLEVNYGEVQLDSLMQPTDVVNDGGQNAKSSKKWNRLKHLKRQLGAQYTKYGSRWLISAAFLVWALMLMVFGIVTNVNNEPELIYFYLIFRAITGFCDGAILVSIQGLVAKEVPPAHRVAASSILGISMPVGTFLGTIIRYWYLSEKPIKSNAHVDVVMWCGATALIFCIVVFIWLAGAIDESIDRSDLIEHKEEIEKYKERQRSSKYGIGDTATESSIMKRAKGGFCRGMTRITCFSWFECVWLHKFGSIRMAALVNFCWAFTIFSTTSWLPSAVHSHNDLFDELRAVTGAIAAAETKELADSPHEDEELESKIEESAKDDEQDVGSPVFNQFMNLISGNGFGNDEANEEGDEDQIPIDAAEILKLKNDGILSDEEAGKALLKALEYSSKRRLGLAEKKEKLRQRMKNRPSELGLGKNKLKEVDSTTVKEASSLGFRHHEDGNIELEDKQQILIWSGITLTGIGSTWLFSFLSTQNGLNAKFAWAPSVLIGTVIPAGIFLYIGIALHDSSELTPKELDDQFKNYVQLVICALVFAGLCIPPVYATQNILAPFKAGSVYSIFSFCGTLGDLLAVVMAILTPQICQYLGVMYFSVVSWSAVACFVTCFVAWWLIDYSMIAELCPTEVDGSESKRLKSLKPVETPEGGLD